MNPRLCKKAPIIDLVALQFRLLFFLSFRLPRDKPIFGPHQQEPKQEPQSGEHSAPGSHKHVNTARLSIMQAQWSETSVQSSFE
jgi:hypothetical protein